MSLRDLLVHQMPRDTSGALSSDRFQYQHNWALCRLLTLHQEQTDYVMTLDHHEDVTILDSEDQPQCMQGFQIKTKSSGNWTVPALLKQQEGKEGELPSILAKLCELQRQFPDHVTLLQVVSNAPLSVKLENGSKGVSKKNIRFLEIATESRKAILDALTKAFAPASPPVVTTIFEFQVSDLSLEDHVTHTKGKLNDALEKLFPGATFPLSPAYRALLGEITARNNNREPCSTYEEFLSKKSISKSRFSAILQSCGIAPKQPRWTSAESRLNAENVPFSIVRSLEEEWTNAILDRFERRNAVHLRFLERVQRAAENVKSEKTLLDALDKGAGEVKESLRPEWAYSDMYIKACILVYLYES
jgi:transposase